MRVPVCCLLIKLLLRYIDVYTSHVFSVYSTFIMMLNMVSFTSMEVTEKATLYILHMIFAIIVIILLLNLLIAVLSNSVSLIMSNLTVEITIHKTVNLYLAELKLAKIPWLHQKLQKRNFVFKDDRIFVRTIMINFGENISNNIEEVD